MQSILSLISDLSSVSMLLPFETLDSTYCDYVLGFAVDLSFVCL